MTALVQSNIFDFKPRIVPRRDVSLLEKCNWTDSGYVEAYRSDAEAYVRDLWQIPAPGTCTNIRLLQNDYHNDLVKGHYYRSGEGIVEEYPFYSFIQRMGGGLHKEIGDDVTEWVSFREYNPSTHDYDGEIEPVDLAYIDGDILHIESTKGHAKEILIVDDDRCGKHDRAHWDPSLKTEHFLIECLRHGVPVGELTWVLGRHACELWMYLPFARDLTTGRMAPYQVHDKILELAARIGVFPQFHYGPEKPRPEKWDVLPAYLKHYCAHAKGCQQKKDAVGCTCCERFLYDRTPVKPEHLDDPHRKKRKPKRCECEDYCGDEDE